MKYRLENNLFNKIAILILFLGLVSAQLWAKKIPAKPSTLLNDYAKILSNEEAKQLELQLEEISRTTSNQIAVVIDKSLEDESLEDYANTLFEQWGIGKDQKDNGVLLYFAMEERKIRIEVGYGLEPVITDALASRIISRTLVPNFKQSNYYEGISQAVLELSALAKGEFNEQDYQKERKEINPWIIVLIIIIVFVLSLINRRGGGNNKGYRRFSSPSTPPIFWGGSGKSSWGGGGGGGWGGFGGGSSGGGGASGGW